MVAGDPYGLRPVARVSDVGAPFPGSEGTSPVLKGARSNLLRMFWFGSQSPLSDEREENLCKELVWGGGGVPQPGTNLDGSYIISASGDEVFNYVVSRIVCFLLNYITSPIFYCYTILQTLLSKREEFSFYCHRATKL